MSGVGGVFFSRQYLPTPDNETTITMRQCYTIPRCPSPWDHISHEIPLSSPLLLYPTSLSCATSPAATHRSAGSEW